MNNKLSVILQNKETKILSQQEYYDNTSIASIGEHLFLDIYIELKEKGQISFIENEIKVCINNTEDLLKYFNAMGYNDYGNIIFRKIYNYQTHKIRYEK